jgi:hypothetical protein
MMVIVNSHVFSQRITVESGDVVWLSLRGSSQLAREVCGEAILDVNWSGNWVRGLEIVGGFVPFSVGRAVGPFRPVLPGLAGARRPGTVTYDPDADAAFIYLEYGPAFGLLAPEQKASATVVSHSINPTATYGLDEAGGLVWVKIPVADAARSADEFLRLLFK